MSDENEQLFGQQGINHDQGYRDMIVSDPVSSDDQLPTSDEMMSEGELNHFRRPEPPAPVEREYYNQATGERTDERAVVSPEQAAHDVANARAAERQALEEQRAADLKFALDQLGEPPAEHPQQPAQEHQQQPELEVQPEAVDDHTQADAAWLEADKKITEILSDPVVRERISAEYGAVVQNAEARVQQAAQQAEQAKQAFAQHTAALAAESNAILLAQFPELASQNADELRGKLQMLNQSNPQRAQAFVQLATKVQQVAMVQQQQAQAFQAAQEKQAAEAFRQYAEAEDAKALAGETPESISTIRKTIFADAKAAGISEKELYEAYNSVPALRHSFVQGLLADGAKWRASQRALATQRHNPIPRVQRPGVSENGPRDDSELSGLQGRFNLNPTRELAAQLIAARRNSR